MQDYTTTLNALLHDAHLTRAELSRLIGVSPRNISRWNSHGIPQYAVAYLKLKAEYIALHKKTAQLSQQGGISFGRNKYPQG